MAVVPMDDSWRTNFVRLESGVFLALAHELVYYLAGARATDFNLRPGQPLKYRPERDESPAPVSVQPPEGEAKTIPPSIWPPVYDDTRETGVYTVKTPDSRTLYYVVQPDLAESDLALSKPEDREQVTNKIGHKVNLRYEDEREKIIGGDDSPPKLELWWLFLVIVTLLLCAEVWMTRRIALNR
jgi:hypothetical protein